MVRPSQFAAELVRLDAGLIDVPDATTRHRRLSDALLRAHPELRAQDADGLVRWWQGESFVTRAAG
jgi:hypothetical protein